MQNRKIRGFRNRVEAIEAFHEGRTIAEIAQQHGVHPTTVWRWIRRFEHGGLEQLMEGFYKHSSGTLKQLEQKVMMLKEHNPSLTIRKAQKTLKKRGIALSLGTIHNIWRRYNLLKTEVENPDMPFNSYALPEITYPVSYVAHLLEKDKRRETLKRASQILNAIPYPLHDGEILKKIPYTLLSPRRRLERTYLDFLDIPSPEFYKRTHSIRNYFEKRGLLYSSIIAGISEVLALMRMRQPKKELELLHLLKKRTEHMYDPGINSVLTYFLCMNSAQLMQVKRAINYARKYQKFLYAFQLPLFYESYGNLLTFMTKYNKSLQYYQTALEKQENPNSQQRLLLKISLGFAITGQYRESKRMLTTQIEKTAVEKHWSTYTSARIFTSFGTGKLPKASHYVQELLKKSKREHLRHSIYISSLCLAGISAALGKRKEALTILKKFLPLYEKYTLLWEHTAIRFLLGTNVRSEAAKRFPMFRLLYLLRRAHVSLKRKDYLYAFDFAVRNGIAGIFHRFIVFFPESVNQLIQQGKPTGLPRSILHFPLFRKELPVFTVHFLGDPIIYRNQRYLKISLQPKDAAFLIFLAHAQSSRISLERIYENFWPRSSYAPRNLAHLLVRLRKSIKIPTQFLYVKERSLLCDCYFQTDYAQSQEHLAQGKALLNGGEWRYAKREFSAAFKLFRGEPFRKMYDNWSDDKRLEILFTLETEVLAFAKELLRRERKEEASRLLKKAQKIVPYSDEIETVLKEINGH